MARPILITCRDVIQNLRKRSLILDGESGRCLVMHRSVQQGILHRLMQDPAAQQKSFRNAFSIVRQKTPRSSPIQVPILETSHMQRYTKAMPHIMSLRAGFLRANNSPVDLAEQFVQLLYDAGITLWWQGITKGKRIVCARLIMMPNLLR